MSRDMIRVSPLLAILVGLGAAAAWRAGATTPAEPPPAPEAIAHAVIEPLPPHLRLPPIPDDDQSEDDGALGPAPGEPTVKFHDWSLRVAAAARRGLERRPKGFRDDCSGFVSGILTDAGLLTDGTVAEIWAAADEAGLTHHHPIPHIGDLAFFDNTYDRNGNGKWDDARTHIAVVVDVEPDGTIVLVHHGSKRSTLRMNLFQPNTHEADGVEKNGWLRRKRRLSDPAYSVHLAGALWSGFAHPEEGAAWVTPSASTARKRQAGLLP